MSPLQLVLDTNVLVAGLRSQRGASYYLLSILRDKRWQINLSVALALEYEEVLKRESQVLSLNFTEVDTIVNTLCIIANRRAIAYHWRPLAHDPDDDFLVELALNIRADYLITYNQRDMIELSKLGMKVVTPKEFLQLVGEFTGGNP